MSTDAINPRSPVIVGVAQQGHRLSDPSEGVEAIELMERVLRRAAEDSGSSEVLTGLDLVAVVKGAWRYSDPGRLLADAVGADQARTLLSYEGGNTPQSLLNGLSLRIARGDLDAVAITGAETIWSRRRLKAAGERPPTTKQDPSIVPDERFSDDIAMSTRFEADRGLEAPIHFYPIFESAIRANGGEPLDQHRRRIAELWAGFNQVGSANPEAWSPDPLTADQIAAATPDNRMIGYPYTKVMNSNWDLDQGTAIILCSVERAIELGIDRDRWVFPLAGTDGHDTYAVSNRRDLHSSPAIAACGRGLTELTGHAPADADHVDLYSCFPSAVQVGAAELGIGLDRQLTVTGGLPFAGGPLSNYVSHSIVTMVGVLRDDPGSLGLVSANGGYLTKHALALYSTEPGPDLFAHRDMQDEIDQVTTVPDDTDHTGPGTIEGYTVMHEKDGPATALAAITTPDGARTWANSRDDAVMAALLETEGVGRSVTVADDGTFTLVDA